MSFILAPALLPWARWAWLAGSGRPRHAAPARPLLDPGPARSFSRPALDGHALAAGPNRLAMKRFLRHQGLDFRESTAALGLDVPRHLLLAQDTPPSGWAEVEDALSTVYVNRTTGHFLAPTVGVYGSWATLRDFLLAWRLNRGRDHGQPHESYPRLARLDLSTPPEVQALWERGRPVESLSAGQWRQLLKGLGWPARELKGGDWSGWDVRVEVDSGSLLCAVRYPHEGRPLVGLRRLRPDPARPQSHIEDSLPRVGPEAAHRIWPLPLGLDRAGGAGSLVLVSNALDALIVGTRTLARPVALSEGGHNLHPDLLPFFEPYQDIRLWFASEASEAGGTFARKLGDQRCGLVSRDYGSPLACLQRKANLAQVLEKHTRACAHQFITTFDTLRQDVFLELAHPRDVAGVKFQRFEALNDLLGGFRRGELSIFSGKTGTGKTTFMSEYSLDLCMQGVNTLWGSFEVKNTRLAKMQLKQFAALNLEEHIDQFDAWADRFQQLSMYYLTFHGAQQVDLVLDAMGHAVYIHDIAHVIIDNLQFMMGLSDKGMDRFYTQDVIIQRFRKFATLHNVHVTLVMHPRKESEDALSANSISGGAKATQEADNVILLQQESVSPTVNKKFIQVVKNRFSGDLGTFPLYFDKGTLTFSKKIFMKERAKRKTSSGPVAAAAPPSSETVSVPPEYR
eukprot:maker-scaffold17_size721972-snap-gene-1.22 protein:Tk09959 transcript:maker-scaffold17_size721972-snap-gene-1.22-mRNA-1 annotation:"twinkle mitochondrial"